VAHVGKKRCLGAVDFGKRFSAAAFLLVRSGIRDRTGDAAGHQFEESLVLILKLASRARAHD
jgi:hypothetical protein